MRPSRTRRPLLIEGLEDRRVPSGLPAGTIGVGTAVVPSPRAVGRVGSEVAPRNLAEHRPSTVIGLDARPLPGGRLAPKVVSAEGPLGHRLPLKVGAPFVAGRNGKALAFTKDGRAGTLTAGVTGRAGTTGSAALSTFLPGDVNGDGRVDLDDLQAFAPAYNSRIGDPNYLPSADADRNGQVGQGDARLILRNLTPIGPKVPLTIRVSLAPEDRAKDFPAVSDPDGVTRRSDVTIVGQTTPGSFVFLDGPNDADYAFEEKAIPTDAQGNFSYRLHLDGALTNTEYLAIDPYGQQAIRALPIRLVS